MPDMKNLTLENLARVCGGRFVGSAADLGRAVSAVTTDSRAVTPGCLFAAIAGERADGHDFVSGALEGGALCALVEREVPCAGNQLVVPDTLAALQAAAAFYRAQFDIPVLGVTGSVGKTTAKEMLSAVLSQRFCVHKTAGNFNNDLGVPLTLFGLREEHSFAVVEMGVSHPGDMERLARMVRPTASLFTVIGHAHLEFLKSREGILAEKSVANDYLPPDGVVFCNGDDDLLRAMETPLRKITFGLSDGCDVRAENVRTLPDGGTLCTVSGFGRRFEAVIPAYGEHMVTAALEGTAVGMHYGLTDGEIAAGIAAYAPVGRRARRVETGRITLIDDCYNANPTSTASALRSLARAEGRRIAILGDMLELGAESARLHYETGVLAAACADAVLCAGPASAEIARGAGDRGRHFESRDSLIAALPALIAPGDTVLVKASRSLHFEEIAAALEAL